MMKIAVRLGQMSQTRVCKTDKRLEPELSLSRLPVHFECRLEPYSGPLAFICYCT